MNEQTPQSKYQELLRQQLAQLAELQKRRRRLGRSRFLVFVITIFLSYQVFVSAGLLGLLPLLAGIGFLLFLVSRDVANNNSIRNVQTLVLVNEEELKILQHDFHHRYDGAHFAPERHDYANDLDLFGKASLYQWLNRCFTEQGRALLAANLLEALPVEQLKQRHAALKELAPQVQWRQQFQAFSQQTGVSTATERRTLLWISEEERHFTAGYWKIIVWAYSLLTLASALATMIGYIPVGVFSFLFGVYLTVSLLLSRNTIRPYLQLSGIVKEIDTMEKLVGWIESGRFHSTLLNRLHEYTAAGNGKASVQIRRLRSILDRFDVRLNIAGLLFLNSFLLWDVRQMMALNDWRRHNRSQIKLWFSTVAEMEVLNSIASLHFNHPGWSLPDFAEPHFRFRAQGLGHPLIPGSARVTSDFDLEGTARIALVTGSNMAGKSTFLRSLGVNAVLAQMGAPVCAGKMELSPVRLMSSMRIADNLAENTSTFYAELKKLKTIIEAVNRGERLFVLLDEILRGTNSYDRHTGSAALMEQMIRHGAVAVIATHDIELAKLEERYPSSIENYHFDVQVEGEELYFDYKLKHGVCTSLNASILMKKIGIELEDS